MRNHYKLRVIDVRILEIMQSAPHGCYAIEVLNVLREDPEWEDITIQQVKSRMTWLKTRNYLVNRDGYDIKNKVWGLGSNTNWRL